MKKNIYCYLQLLFKLFMRKITIWFETLMNNIGNLCVTSNNYECSIDILYFFYM